MKDKSEDLLEQTTTRILAEQEKIEVELNQWKKTFPNQTPPQQIKNEKENNEVLEKQEYRVKSLEELMANRNSRSKLKKKECKICEICSQVRTDNFKYSRISARGFNTYHVYRICSFCQKTVQPIITNS